MGRGAHASLSDSTWVKEVTCVSLFMARLDTRQAAIRSLRVCSIMQLSASCSLGSSVRRAANLSTPIFPLLLRVSSVGKRQTCLLVGLRRHHCSRAQALLRFCWYRSV